MKQISSSTLIFLKIVFVCFNSNTFFIWNTKLENFLNWKEDLPLAFQFLGIVKTVYLTSFSQTYSIVSINFTTKLSDKTEKWWGRMAGRRRKWRERRERVLLQSHCVGRLFWVPLHPTLWLCECWYENSQLWKWRKCPEFQVWDDLVQKEGQRSLKADLTLEAHISRCRNLQEEFRFLEAAE